MNEDASVVIPEEQLAELQALGEMPDDQINTRDIPEQKDWSGAQRGLFSPYEKVAQHTHD